MSRGDGTSSPPPSCKLAGENLRLFHKNKMDSVQNKPVYQMDDDILKRCIRVINRKWELRFVVRLYLGLHRLYVRR